MQTTEAVLDMIAGERQDPGEILNTVHSAIKLKRHAT